MGFQAAVRLSGHLPFTSRRLQRPAGAINARPRPRWRRSRTPVEPSLDVPSTGGGREREERDEENPTEVALRIHDPRVGARRPVRVEPDRDPDAQLVRQQRDGDETDGDYGEKREEHLQTNHTKGSRS